MSNPPADYDNPWKVALEDYSEPFLTFFFPATHALVDWARPPESLDKELEQVLRDAELGKCWADKLFKVWLQDNQATGILMHIEAKPGKDTPLAVNGIEDIRHQLR